VRESAILRPLRFRFQDADDVERFGDGWHVYDEGRIVRLPARELVALEIELGMPIVGVVQGMRTESVLGYLAGTWLALRMEDPALAGRFDDYTPIAMLIVWDRIPDDEPKADMSGPLEPTPSESSPDTPSTE
jgi:hypothetical protein